MQIAGLRVEQAEYATLEEWVRFWAVWTGAAFLRAYREVAGDAAFVPRPRRAVALMLELYLTDKALYELTYELNNRPHWTHIPLKGLLQILDQPHEG